MKSREIHLVKRPEGMPQPNEFAVVERDVPDAGEGQILVQNLYMSVDPAMRPRLTNGQALDEPMGGGAIGRVVQSKNPGFKEGDLVKHSKFGDGIVTRIDASGVTKVDWSRGSGMSARAKGDVVTIPAGLRIAGTQLIWSEAEYLFTPPVGYFLTGPITMKDQFFARPRQSNTVAGPTS